MKYILATLLSLFSISAFAQSYHVVQDKSTYYIYRDQVNNRNPNSYVGSVQVVQPRRYQEFETSTEWNLDTNNIRVRNRTGSISTSYKVFNDDSEDD